MDWLQKINGAMDYIEGNLADDIDYNAAARIACCSVYHFQRMFSFITEIPLAEYIRRRRLTLAAFELQNSSIKVIDLALKYGYDSPDAFSRAFQNMHGITPTSARELGAKLKAYPRLSFHISIKGDVEMNYRIVESGAYTVFGKSITVGIDQNPYEVIPKLWVDFQEDGTYQKICRAAGFEPYSGTLLNAALYDFINDGSYRNKYIIFARLKPGVDVPEGLDVLTIPASRWAVFSAEYGAAEDTTPIIQHLWNRVFTEWFPTSGYEAAEGPQLEVYPEDSKTVEVWIPVVKK
jgi:AraC family transcriptional regulator